MQILSIYFIEIELIDLMDSNKLYMNILQYESKIWATADLLIGAGIKQSDFPKFMMPFFALIMVESRFIKLAEEIKKDFKNEELDDFIDEVKDEIDLKPFSNSEITVFRNF